MATKSAAINMRVFPSVRDVIDAAANLQNVDRTVFIQQAALNEAQNVLANQKDFKLEQKAFEAFEKALEEPPQILEGIQDLFQRKSPWD
ncbi:type II toxin-antitoxin system TacA family antitoxin [Vibrio alfacsensis]|uniref:type II toxin-antitoxin system TacA family antitoxin n=1 Tax=Vibrio TaxID=662 RepID=UPI004068696A